MTAKYLVFDTETSGLPQRWDAPSTDLANWPRLVQLAWTTLVPGQERVGGVHVHIVQPGGFTIPEEAAAVHGLTTARAEREGRPLGEVLSAFALALEGADVLVAHNAPFDARVMGTEYVRTWGVDLLRGRPLICTQRASTGFCRLPAPWGPSRYKWPRLEELYEILFGEGMEGAHDAGADVVACARCFLELQRRGVLGGSSPAHKRMQDRADLCAPPPGFGR